MFEFLLFAVVVICAIGMICALDGSHELITAPHHCRDKSLILRPPRQGFAQGRYMNFKIAFLYHRLWPRTSHQFPLGDEFSTMLHERSEQIKSSTAKWHA